jgi:hypothetical protein
MKWIIYANPKGNIHQYFTNKVHEMFTNVQDSVRQNKGWGRRGGGTIEKRDQERKCQRILIFE